MFKYPNIVSLKVSSTELHKTTCKRRIRKALASNVETCSYSDLGEFLFRWRNCCDCVGQKWQLSSRFFLDFPSVKFHENWQIDCICFALRTVHFSRKSLRPVIEEWGETHKFANNKKAALTISVFPVKYLCLGSIYTFGELRKFHRSKLKNIAKINAEWLICSGCHNRPFSIY